MPEMFKKMSFKSAFGTTSPNAVWRLTELHATLDGVRLVFQGYHSQAAHDSGSAALPGAVKEYTLPAGTISQFPELETAIHQAAWNVALAWLEGPPPAEGEPDTRTSFFAGGTDA